MRCLGIEMKGAASRRTKVIKFALKINFYYSYFILSKPSSESVTRDRLG